MNRNVRQLTFGQVLPVKIQISLRFRTVWSEPSQGTFRIAKDAEILHADKEGSGQTARVRIHWE